VRDGGCEAESADGCITILLMLLLVSGATNDVRQYTTREIGFLFTPTVGNAYHSIGNYPWALDNGAYSGFDEWRFRRALDRATDVLATCLFVVCPDVVGDATATGRLFHRWHPQIRRLGFPVAFVAQDGLKPHQIPWWAFDAFFVGGTTEFKLSPLVLDLLTEARERGKHRHVGRVNTRRRLQHFYGYCESFDGSGFSRWPKRIHLMKRWQTELQTQRRLW
jgi:hypothetical protein